MATTLEVEAVSETKTRRYFRNEAEWEGYWELVEEYDRQNGRVYWSVTHNGWVSLECFYSPGRDEFRVTYGKSLVKQIPAVVRAYVNCSQFDKEA